MDRRMGGPQTRTLWRIENLALPGIEAGFSNPQPIAMPYKF
jgi:hypothetical protein